MIEVGKTDFLTVEVESEGVPVKVTAFERTLVDVLHRADRAGGRDEVIECLNVAPYLVDDFDCRFRIPAGPGLERVSSDCASAVPTTDSEISAAVLARVDLIGDMCRC